jgi:hypothetical protein
MLRACPERSRRKRNDEQTLIWLPDDVLPPDHWAHGYCPYLDICEPGQQAIEWQASQPKTLPDNVLADIIATRIVAKKGAEKMTGKKRPGTRSLTDLAQDLNWD